MDDAQVRERVADFGAFVEAETADDAVGEADRDEAILELARLVLGADQDGDLVIGFAARSRRLDLVADAAGFLGAVPYADDADLFAGVEFCPQRLAQAAAIIGDDARCRAEDMGGGAVILFEADDLCAGEVAFEFQDVFDLRAAP